MTNLASYSSPPFSHPPDLTCQLMVVRGCLKTVQQGGHVQGGDSGLEGGDNTLLATGHQERAAAAGRTTFPRAPSAARLIWKSKPSEEAARKQETFSTKQTDLIRADKVALN